MDQHLSFRSFRYVKRISKIIVSLVHFIITLSDVSANEYFIGCMQKFYNINMDMKRYNDYVGYITLNKSCNKCIVFILYVHWFRNL